MESAERVISLWELVEEQLVNFAEWLLDLLEWAQAQLTQVLSRPVRRPHTSVAHLGLWFSPGSSAAHREFGARPLSTPPVLLQPRPKNQDLFKKNDDLCSPHARSETAFLDYFKGSNTSSPFEHPHHTDVPSPTARQVDDAYARRTGIPEREYAGRAHQPSALGEVPRPPLAPIMRHSFPNPYSDYRPDTADLHASSLQAPATMGGHKPAEAWRGRTLRTRSEDPEHHKQASRTGSGAAPPCQLQTAPPYQLQTAPQQQFSSDLDTADTAG